MPVADAESQRVDDWYDLGHCHSLVGDSALKAMFGEGGAPADIGINLLDSDWDEVRLQWIEDHETYCNVYKEDVAWWRSLYREAVDKKSQFKE